MFDTIKTNTARNAGTPRKHLPVLAALVLCLAADSALAWYPAHSQTPLPRATVNHRQIRGSEQGFPFNGTTDYLDLGNAPLLQVSGHDFTVEVAVRFTSLTAVDSTCSHTRCGEMSILSKMRSITRKKAVNDNANGWRLLKTVDNHFQFCQGNETNGCASDSSSKVQSTTVAEVDTWYHVIARKAYGTLSIVVNGTPEATVPLGTYTDTNRARLYVGRDTTKETFLAGRIRTIGLYPGPLDAGQIRTLFRNSHIPRLKKASSTDSGGDGTSTTAQTAAAASAPTTTADSSSAGISANAMSLPSSLVSLPGSTARLMVSATPDRAAAQSLDGSTISGPVHAFAEVDQGVRQVTFWLDDPTPDAPRHAPAKIEYLAPFDFMGTTQDGHAVAFDTNGLDSGTHRITTQTITRDGSVRPPVTASFTVIPAASR
jgi:Concanavalin A-like lectin/glucanases superfamily